MKTKDRARLELYQQLDETLGPENTDTLMGYLPAVGLATHEDLRALERRLEAKFDAELARLRAKR